MVPIKTAHIVKIPSQEVKASLKSVIIRVTEESRLVYVKEASFLKFISSHKVDVVKQFKTLITHNNGSVGTTETTSPTKTSTSRSTFLLP